MNNGGTNGVINGGTNRVQRFYLLSTTGLFLGGVKDQYVCHIFC